VSIEQAQFEPRTPATSIRVDIKIDDKELLKTLNAMDLAYSSKAMKSIGTDVGKVIQGVIRQSAPVETGALQRAITYKSKVYRNVNGNTLCVIVGADTDVLVYDSKKQLRRPSKYLHLVEAGFTHRSGKVIAGKRFMQRSADANKDIIDQYALNGLRNAVKDFVTS
jgi:HK97 gp10 family phage protein